MSETRNRARIDWCSPMHAGCAGESAARFEAETPLGRERGKNVGKHPTVVGTDSAGEPGPLGCVVGAARNRVGGGSGPHGQRWASAENTGENIEKGSDWVAAMCL
jgi:hypothetical protein